MSRPRLVESATRAPTLEEIRQWPATVPVPLACKAIGISRSHGYELLVRGVFPVRALTIGSTRRIVTADLIRLLSADGTEAAV